MSPAQSLRTSAGGYARGDETRQRIIDAAVKLFGERGFDDASTRDIAAAAGVNAPALRYYFKSKEGLYQACAECITEDARARFEPAVQHATEVLGSDGDTDALIDAYLGIQDVMMDSVLLQAVSSSRRLFVARELGGGESSVASKFLKQRLRQPLHKVSMALLARIGGTALDDPLTGIRLISLKGQYMPFFYTPATLELLGWKKIDEARGMLLKTTLRSQMRTLLESWSSASADSRRKR